MHRLLCALLLLALIPSTFAASNEPTGPGTWQLVLADDFTTDAGWTDEDGYQSWIGAYRVTPDLHHTGIDVYTMWRSGISLAAGEYIRIEGDIVDVEGWSVMAYIRLDAAGNVRLWNQQLDIIGYYFTPSAPNSTSGHFIAHHLTTGVATRIGFDAPSPGTGIDNLRVYRWVPAPSNLPPVADAGADQATVCFATVTLDGSASSDPDGQPSPLTWSWAQSGGPETVTLSGADTATPSFTAPNAGDYTFVLTVSDGLESRTDTVTVTVDHVEPHWHEILRDGFDVEGPWTGGVERTVIVGWRTIRFFGRVIRIPIFGRVVESMYRESPDLAWTGPRLHPVRRDLPVAIAAGDRVRVSMRITGQPPRLRGVLQLAGQALSLTASGAGYDATTRTLTFEFTATAAATTVDVLLLSRQAGLDDLVIRVLDPGCGHLPPPVGNG